MRFIGLTRRAIRKENLGSVGHTVVLVGADFVKKKVCYLDPNIPYGYGVTRKLFVSSFSDFSEALIQRVRIKDGEVFVEAHYSENFNASVSHNFSR